MAKGVTKSLITFPKKGSLKQCQNYRTISLISHSSKIMLRLILNRLKAKAEERLAEERAGLRPGRSTVEQIFKTRVVVEKQLQYQRDLFHNSTDFKTTFYSIWHAGVWHVLKSFNTEKGLVQAFKAVYKNGGSAVLLHSQTGEKERENQSN